MGEAVQVRIIALVVVSNQQELLWEEGMHHTGAEKEGGRELAR